MRTIRAENYQFPQGVGKRKVKRGLITLFLSVVLRVTFASTGVPGLPMPENPDDALVHTIQQVVLIRALAAINRKRNPKA
ncbi:MAG: hypothetical protein AB7H66_10910 [Hyphomonadaceae bacterium]